MNIADKLKQLRTDKNMTQMQLANALGINQGMLSRWESGATAPSLKLRRLIADYFEMSVSEIFGSN